MLDLSANETVSGDWTYSGDLAVPSGAGGTTVDTIGQVTIDSTPVYGHFNFHDGTAEMSIAPLQHKTLVIDTPVSGDDFTMFHTEEAITVKILRAVLVGSSTPSVTVDIHHSTDRSAAGNALTASGEVVTSVTTGTDVTSFNDATIPADSWVWVDIDAQSGTVLSASITLHYTVDA